MGDGRRDEGWMFVRANEHSNRIHLIHEHTHTHQYTDICVEPPLQLFRHGIQVWSISKHTTQSRFIFICHFAALFISFHLSRP